MRPMVDIFKALLDILHVFLNTFKQYSELLAPPDYELSDINEGSMLQISAKRERQDAFTRLSLGLVLSDCFSKVSIKLLLTSNFYFTSSL